jgi:hypothetical protein
MLYIYQVILLSWPWCYTRSCPPAETSYALHISSNFTVLAMMLHQILSTCTDQLRFISTNLTALVMMFRQTFSPAQTTETSYSTLYIKQILCSGPVNLAHEPQNYEKYEVILFVHWILNGHVHLQMAITFSKLEMFTYGPLWFIIFAFNESSIWWVHTNKCSKIPCWIFVLPPAFASWCPHCTLFNQMCSILLLSNEKCSIYLKE